MSNPKPTCPACGKILTSYKAVPKHVNGCPRWDEVIGVPPSEFNFERHFGRGLYHPDYVEGVDYVVCQECLKQGVETRNLRLKTHLRVVHGITVQEYADRHPGAPVKLQKSVNRWCGYPPGEVR